MWVFFLLYFIVCSFICILKNAGENNLKKIHFLFKLFMTFILFFLSACIACPVFLLRPRNIHNGNIYSRCIIFMNKLLGLEWHLRNGEILSQERGAIIIANHQSALDMLGIFTMWNVVGKLRVVIKKELLYTGPLGVAAYLGGGIFIKRNDPKSAYKILQITTEVLTTNKTKIWIYPEGTRNKGRIRKLLPFKKGAFNMAIKAQVPIIPVLFSPYYFLDTEKYIFNKGHVIVQCLEPVPTDGLTLEDVPELTERLHAVMTAAYEKLSDEVLDSQDISRI